VKLKALIPCLTLACASAVFAHDDAAKPDDPDADRLIVFPDTADYLTLSVDLHTHSVFSDGHVWPRTRVEEALRDGLDALAITEHLEWQPHRADIIHPDRNRSFEIARASARETGLLVIPGSEITRSMPVGHINAIFLTDSNALLSETAGAKSAIDPAEYSRLTRQWPAENALRVANEQGGFVFWNHPDWTDQAPDGIARPTDFHLAAFARGELHGIEIANGDTYSEEAFQVALDHELTLIGVSDIHELIDWDYEPHKGGHRPVTLVFASERSNLGIRDALFERRTVVWYKNTLMGRPEHLLPLLRASLVPGNAEYVAETDTAIVPLSNRSDARFILENRSGLTFINAGDLIEIPPHETVELQVKTRERLDEITLDFAVRNALVAPKESAGMRLRVPVSAPAGQADD
jgi:predicted metal-dependent phosphoesterase TrpH